MYSDRGIQWEDIAAGARIRLRECYFWTFATFGGKDFCVSASNTSQQRSSRGEPRGSINLRAGEGHVILSYRTRKYDEPWTSKEYPVSLEWTRCNYGGSRVWFRCPANGCGRRV